MRQKHKQAEEMKGEEKLMGCEESEWSRVSPGAQPGKLQGDASQALESFRSQEFLQVFMCHSEDGNVLLGDFAIVQHHR